MPGRYFVDSNVVLYLYSEDEPAKKAPAEVVTHGQERAWISTQVLSEMANVLRRKFRLEFPDIAAAVAEVRAACDVYIVTPETIALALRLGERYRHSYFDSLSSLRPWNAAATRWRAKTCRMDCSSNLA